ncbi:MAG: PDZ domain-containing protein [FCB group bacterium]|nr:PDZ domain-containing protein [FCB group bacterium]
MNRFKKTAQFSLLLALSVFLPVAVLQADSSPNLNDWSAVYEKIDRILVTVEYRAEMTFMGQSEDIKGRVLGIAVEPEGTIIFDGTTLGTGSHFGSGSMSAPRVEKPKSLKVTTADGDVYDAEFIGVDQYSSIAFCRLPDSARGKVKTAEFDQVDLELGDELFIFWMLPNKYKPRFQMDNTSITGILEKPEPLYLTGELTGDFIMSPAVTSKGKMVGVITPITQSNGSYSGYDYGGVFGNPVGIMPLDQFNKLLAKPPEPEKYKRGWMGITLQALDPEIGEFWGLDVPGGIIVSNIVAHSPAEMAGLTPGDFIVGFDGEPIEVTQDANLLIFQRKISELGEGVDVDLTVIRPEDEAIDTLQIVVTLGKVPVSAAEAPNYKDKNFDLTIRDLVFADYNNRDIDPDKLKGVMVDKMEAGGWAAVGRVRAGDIIMKIGDQIVTSVEACESIFVQMEKDRSKEVVFMIWRNHQTKFVNIKMHWE